jgi:hypothetical protein
MQATAVHRFRGPETPEQNLKLRPARDTGKLVWGIWGRRPVNRSDLLRGALRPWRPLAQGGLSIKEVTPKFCGQRQRLEHEVSCKQQAPLLAVPRSPLGEGSRHLTPPTPTHPPHLAPTHLPSTSKPARPQPLIVRLSRTLFHKLRHRALLTLGAHYETQKQSRKPMPVRTTANRHLTARTGQIVPASSRPRSPVHRVVNRSAISPRVRGCLAWASGQGPLRRVSKLKVDTEYSMRRASPPAATRHGRCSIAWQRPRTVR